MDDLYNWTPDPQQAAAANRYLNAKFDEPQPTAPEHRAAFDEVISQLKAGVYSDIPRIAGEALQYASSPGNSLYNTGADLVDSANAVASLPEMQPGDTEGRPVVKALSQGARMVPAAAGAVGVGLLASEVGLPAAGAALVGGALPAIPFALSRAQETYEAGLKKHGITPEQAEAMPDDPRVREALNASRLTGGIEFAANTVGGALANRMVGVGGKFVAPLLGKVLNSGEQTAAQGVIRSFVNPQNLARFGLDTLETGAEQTGVQAARAGAETAVEKAHGYTDQSPWEAAKETVAPTLGMTALMAPLGIPGRVSQARGLAHVVDLLGNHEYSLEARTQAAEAVFNRLNEVSPDAAHNFAARAFDAIHGHEETGSAPYSLTLDGSAIEPFTPMALRHDETATTGDVANAAAPEQPTPNGALSRALSKAMPEQGPQTGQPPATVHNFVEHPEHVTPLGVGEVFDSAGEKSIPPGTSDQAPENPAEITNPVLHHFLESGREKTLQSGQGLHVWDKPAKPFMDAAMRDYVLPGVEAGHIARDSEGGYLIHGDKGTLRVVPPADPEGGNYRVEYHAPVAGPEAAPLNPLQQRIYESLSQKQQAGEQLSDFQTNIMNKLAAIAPTDNAPEAPQEHGVSLKAVEKAFPNQQITEERDGFKVSLKNGAMVHVSSAGDILFDTAAARAAHDREVGTDEKPVASFQRLGRDAVISLTEKGAGQIGHETFHAAMELALNPSQRDWIIKKYSSEEAAAEAYQKLVNSGAFESKSEKTPLYLKVFHNFFGKVRDLVDPAARPAADTLKDIATGRVWEQEPEGIRRDNAIRYSFTADTAKSIKEASANLNRFADKSTFIKSDVKPAMKAAGEGLAAAWDGVKAAVNPMGRSAAAEEAGRILIEGMGRMEHGREQLVTDLNKAAFKATRNVTATAKSLDLMQNSTTLADKVFNTMPEAERIDFMNRIDNGQKQPTVELQRIADVISTMFTEKAEAVQRLGTGALENVRESYFPHVWERSGDAAREISAALSKRPLEGGKAFTRSRVFDDIMEGINAGYKLVSTNPVDLVFLKLAEMDRYINAHTALQAMEESGLVRLIPAGEKMPEGFGDISGRYGIVTKKGFMDPATGMESEPKSYRYVAREDVAQVFNNYLSQNLYNNKYVGNPFKAYMGAANMLNQFQLGVFSAFHAGFTSLEAVISHGALGMKALSRGDFKEAGKYFREAPAAWLLNPKLGDKVLKAWMGDPAAAQEMPQIVEWLEMAGARRMLDQRFRTNQTQKMFQAWADGNKTGAAVRLIPAIVEQSARPIMEWLVPRQKFGVFAEMANDWARRNPGATHEETRTEMQRIWNRVDSRLGQVVYDRLFVHNVAKNLAQAIIRAPGWTGGTILEVGGGLKDLAGFAKDTARGRKPELSNRAAYTLSLLVTTAIANATLTALFTGETPKDWKDLAAFRTGNIDEHGNPERFMLPSYAKDLYAYMEQPGATLMHKTHPLLSLAGDLVENKDYYGTEIRHTGDNPVMQLAQMAGFTAKAFVPFWMKGFSKEHERGGSLLSMGAPLVGVMPAPADMNKTEAEKLAGELVRARMPNTTRTQEQADRSQLIAHLTSQARRNRASGLEEVNAALRAGEIKRLQALHIMQNARMTPLQVAFRRLSYDEAQRVYEVADSSEKRQLRRMFQAKRENAGRG